MRGRRRRPLLTVLLLFLALLAAGCGGGGDDATESGGEGGSGSVAESGKTFSDDEFRLTFTYPDDMKEGEVTQIDESAGEGKAVARAALGFDSDNIIGLTKYELSAFVTSANLRGVMPELNGVVSDLAGRPMEGEVTEIGGFPAARYDVLALDAPAQGETRLVYLFDQNVEYQVNCQSTPAKRTELNAACDQVLATLRRA